MLYPPRRMLCLVPPLDDDVDPEPVLLARCRRGEGRAWDALFDRHYAAVARFVHGLGADLDDAEEICQDTFLAVIRSLETFDGRSQFQTWLLRIAANKARDHRDRVRAAKRGGGVRPVSLNGESEHGAAPPDPPSPRPGPDAVLSDQEDAARLRACLDELGDPCREILDLRYFADLSYEEIAAGLRLNVKTVSSRLSKCLDRLGALVRRRQQDDVAPTGTSFHPRLTPDAR